MFWTALQVLLMFFVVFLPVIASWIAERQSWTAAAGRVLFYVILGGFGIATIALLFV